MDETTSKVKAEDKTNKLKRAANKSDQDTSPKQGGKKSKNQRETTKEEKKMGNLLSKWLTWGSSDTEARVYSAILHQSFIRELQQLLHYIMLVYVKLRVLEDTRTLVV